MKEKPNKIILQGKKGCFVSCKWEWKTPEEPEEESI